MTYIDLTYLPGTQKSPQQTEISMRSFTDTDKVHFPDGRLQTIPPYAATAFIDDYIELTGKCRAIHAIKITSTQVGTYFLMGTSYGLYVGRNGQLYNMTPLQTAAAATLGANPIATTNLSSTVTITYNSHGLAVGDRIKLSGASDVAGITAATVINIEHIVTETPTANTFKIILSAEANATTTGGGASVQIFKQIEAGNEDQDAASGYGVGLYGEGVYGIGGPSQGAQIFPRIWSFANFGNEIVMCPGDYNTGNGQKIYIWDGNTAIAPTVLTNAPTDCNWVNVVNNSVVALCGETVKISEIGDATVWSGVTYYEVPLQRVWKLISCHVFNEKNAVIFTPNEAFLLRYVGGADIWDLSDLTLEDGIIAPYAACVLDSSMYWRGYRGSYAYNGSPPAKIDNPQNDDWIIENTNFGKNWKSFAYPDSQSHEWYFHWAIPTESEPTDYVIHNIVNGSHTLGKMDRTSAQRPYTIDTLFYMAEDAAGSPTLYRHFIQAPTTFSWYAYTSMSYGDDANRRVTIDRVYPDSNQDGDITMNMTLQEYPQGTLYVTPNYTISPTTEYLSVKGGGRLVGFRISGTNVAYNMGAWKFNARPLGRRA
jgi:hypothetical protein